MPDVWVMKPSRRQRWSCRFAGTVGIPMALTLFFGVAWAGGAHPPGAGSVGQLFRPVESTRFMPRRSRSVARRVIRLLPPSFPTASVSLAAPPTDTGAQTIELVQAGSDDGLDSQFRPIERRHLSDPAPPLTASPSGPPITYGGLPATGYPLWGGIPYSVAPVVPPIPLAPPLGSSYLGLPYGYGYGTVAPPIPAPLYPQLPLPVAPYPQLPYAPSPLLVPPLWPY